MTGATGIQSIRRRQGRATGSTIRVLVAVETTHDRALLGALQTAAPVVGGAFVVTRRAQTAEDLETGLLEDQPDGIVVGEGLFGLGAGTLARCVDAGVPTVVLGSVAHMPSASVLELPPETPAAHVCAVLAAAVWGTSDELGSALEAAGVVFRGPGPSPGPGQSTQKLQSAPTREGQVVVVVGPPRGSVGTTRGSIELAAARERNDSTLLIDGVLEEPSVAAALGLNPARNLTVVAAGVAGSHQAEHWARMLRDEIQPLDPKHSPRAWVLAGVPSAALRNRLDPEFLAELIAHASGQGGFGCVIVDAGAEPAVGTLEGACWRALVELADRVLLVAVPDVVGLRRGIGTLERLEARVERGRLGVVLNRYRRGEHDDAADVATVLRGIPVVAVVPDDVRACTIALRTQRTLGSVGRGRARKELRRLADQLRVTRDDSTLLPRQARRRRWWPWRRP
jgi:MinD-like ATPase involved in chromosome partitioning or flagellar assembly